MLDSFEQVLCFFCIVEVDDFDDSGLFASISIEIFILSDQS